MLKDGLCLLDLPLHLRPRFSPWLRPLLRRPLLPYHQLLLRKQHLYLLRLNQLKLKFSRHPLLPLLQLQLRKQRP